MNMSRIVKVALLSVLSIYALNAVATYETQIERETQERFIAAKRFAQFTGLDQNQVSAISSYFYDKGDDARSFFLDLVIGKRKAAILHANTYIQEKKTQINKLSVNDISAAVKTRAILLATTLGYFAFCKGSTHGEAAIKGLLGATVGYFAYNNPLMKNWFLKSKKDQEMNHLVREFECIHNLDRALDNAQINKHAQELQQLEEIKDIPIKDFFKNISKDEQEEIKMSSLSYQGEIIDPRETIKRSKILAMDGLLGVQNIPWASVDESR